VLLIHQTIKNAIESVKTPQRLSFL